ncbi:putative phage late control D [Afipia carboxidovorans OM5]|uniref:Putative phage late control protein D n=1 Tax=Afipia carboxidovorans (strain ATCC 49405 / DSM 1227 / KCTC 32145 / OM5) TaxID=504832 RepID=B6JEG4_AFIC5|nr:late control protein D [Afipia carboxidovorans]ACI92729.1 putative phage late control D [Afipia carboxidovorans OM5]AEI03519.1 putative phage late control gene D protein [Afipia carboxidovorans OM4]AEI07096.1 putative phage late control protein D [Afipia carboxidovorans OM5]
MPQAIFQAFVGGNAVSESFNQRLESLTVTDKAGTTSDAASVTLDDSDGCLLMPGVGDPMTLNLGWDISGVGLVFDGIIDTIRSAGTHGGGRTMTITAKGFDPKGKAKEPLEFHKDDASLQDFMSEAAGKAGLTFKAHGSVGSIQRPYWSAGTESFIHLGQRIANEIGAQFKIHGTVGIMYPKNAGLAVSGAALTGITALWGDNLIDWDISPVLARPRFERARARFYDPNKAKWMEKIIEIQPQGPSSSATHTHRITRADDGEAQEAATQNQRSSERERGGGSVTIVGNPAAQPEGSCTVIGARHGIDGTYKIEGVEHTLVRGSGYRTRLDLKHPEGDVGSDNRSNN